MAQQESTKQRDSSDYFTDSLWIGFALLTDSIPEAYAAVYLSEGIDGRFVLQGKSPSNVPFVETIAASDLPDLSVDTKRTSPITRWGPSDKDTVQIFSGLEQHSAASILLHPLIKDEQLAGLLTVVLKDEPDDHEQVQRAVSLAGSILQNNLILKSRLDVMDAQNAFLSDLVHHTSSLDIASTSDALFDTLVRLLGGVLSFDRLTISTQSGEVQEGLQIDWVAGLEDNYKPDFAYTPEGVVHGEVFRQAQSMVIGCLEESDYEGRFQPGDFKDSKLVSFLGVPLMAVGIPKGTLALESTTRDHFTTQDLGILDSIAQVYGAALWWTQRYQEVHALATVDGLTQLLNHRWFMSRFGEELERASRYGETMTFLMLDLDHFKNVNDTYGHLHGDYVLWQTAQLVRSCIRKADIAGRYGGEEFGVIIINASKYESLNTAERIKNSISDFAFDNDGIQSRITVSIGMSEYPADGKDVNTLIQRADEAMYAVKRRGGNAIISYSQEIESKELRGE
ncbi:MAG: sensor domain-containing diguanylate cyclase [Fidelibacterota bacterium]|nr:MAG: sensor domain-containing diguanylate cyclase [Candidatus Neomarinimicrobiota bacterium]